MREHESGEEDDGDADDVNEYVRVVRMVRGLGRGERSKGRSVWGETTTRRGATCVERELLFKVEQLRHLTPCLVRLVQAR